MTIIEWAVSVKADLAKLQRATGIPAAFAIAQFCHESYHQNGLSELASKCHNYAGIKWVGGWQESFGGKPVTYGTWEVIDGVQQSLHDAFVSFPDWETWLRAYAYLLNVPRYRPALAYASDPFLYGMHVWRNGWATDPAYLAGIGGWMSRLWPHYADTLPGRGGNDVVVPVRAEGGRLLCNGRLVDGATVVEVRPLASSLGLGVKWLDGAVELAFPGGK
jgi:hypothetical protein